MDGEWLPGRVVADAGWTIEGCPVNGPAIAADGDHVAVARFTAADDETKVRLARSSIIAAWTVRDGEVTGVGSSRIAVASLR